MERTEDATAIASGPVEVETLVDAYGPENGCDFFQFLFNCQDTYTIDLDPEIE
jgi:hypothetical protein